MMHRLTSAALSATVAGRMMMRRETPVLLNGARRHFALRRELTSFAPGEELSFAWITPRSLAKSLEGSILARLLALPGLQLVGARMVAPSGGMVEEYLSAMTSNATEGPWKEAMLSFVDYELREEHNVARGYPNTMMLLIFKGAGAQSTIATAVGQHKPHTAAMGSTIRGAFGTYDVNPESNAVEHFQPACIAPSTTTCNEAYLRVFAEHAEADGGVMSEWWEQHDGDTDGDGIVDKHETGLILIKPDNMERPSSLPGHIIDMITTTGLHCRGCKVFSMTPHMGHQFYGFLEPIFVKKLKGLVEKKVRRQLGERQMGFYISDGDYSGIADVLAPTFAKHEVSEIMKYMTGVDPRSGLTEDEMHVPGPARCFGLLYSGEHAIDVIRAKLGSTNPDEAEVGSVRSDYGKDVMRNGAHASDAPDRALEERHIVGMVGDEPSEEVATIRRYLKLLDSST